MVEFVTGETVHLRHLQRRRPALVFPYRVVEARDDAVMLWAPAGTRGWLFTTPDGRGLAQTPLPEWSASPRVPVSHTVDHGTLSWVPFGRDYSVRWFFRPDGTFLRWYANLEAPSVAWRDGATAGLDTSDWDLDVVVEPDRAWRWKDDEEFTARLAMPRVPLRRILVRLPSGPVVATPAGGAARGLGPAARGSAADVM
jgi:hypothetical protein